MKRNSGFTLIELLIGVFIALTLTLAAVMFATHETRLMGVSEDRVVVAESSRTVLDFMAADLAQAGAGIGYLPDGSYPGLRLDRVVLGACNFNDGAANNMALSSVDRLGAGGAGYNVLTRDVYIAYANGTYATISNFDAASNTGQFCTPPATDPAIQNGEQVVLRRDNGLDWRMATINPGANTGCTNHLCTGGCVNFTFAPLALPLGGGWATAGSSDPAAVTGEYTLGEVQGGLREVVWFVAQNPVDALGKNTTSLRRVEFNANQPSALCPVRDSNLGGLAANNVEMLEVTVSYWDGVGGTGWNLLAPYGAPPGPGIGPNIDAGLSTNPRPRLRADIEFVIRGRRADEKPNPAAQLTLRAGCVPTNCASTDFAARRVFRTSVELKNSGRLGSLRN